jgi:hypothetical protein
MGFRSKSQSAENCHSGIHLFSLKDFIYNQYLYLLILSQCSKLLLETHPFAFYPSKFALITDILDNFGRMVFERIAEKGDIR